MKKLYKWECYFGRMGSLDSVFIADDEFVQSIIGATAMFGEALGKHSDINCILASDQFEVKSDNQLVIQELEEIFGKDELEFYSNAFLELNKLNTEVTTLSGYNPIANIEDDWQKLPFKPDWCIHPGETILECLQGRGMTQVDLAKEINTTSTYVRNLIHGDVAIDQKLAIKLSDIIGSTPRFWLNLEKNYRDHPKSIKLPEND